MASFVGILVLVSVLIVTIQACQFSSSCTDISFHGNTMFAKCKTSHGRIVKTSIDVNDCVGVNYRGALVCSSGFAYKCSDIAYNGLTLGARCNHSPGKVSNQPLDECIGNVGGKLTCC